MASLQQIFGWFSRGLFPTQEQYKQTWSSFWHKSERLPIEQVLGLNAELNDKATKTDLANATTNNKGIFSTDIQLKADYPSENNLKGFFAFVGSQNPFRKWEVQADGGGWIDTGQDVDIADIDLAEYAKNVNDNGEQVVYAPDGIVPVPDDIVTFSDSGDGDNKDITAEVMGYNNTANTSYINYENGKIVSYNNAGAGLTVHYIDLYPLKQGDSMILEVDQSGNTWLNGIQLIWVMRSADTMIEALDFSSGNLTYTAKENCFLRLYTYYHGGTAQPQNRYDIRNSLRVYEKGEGLLLHMGTKSIDVYNLPVPDDVVKYSGGDSQEDITAEVMNYDNTANTSYIDFNNGKIINYNNVGSGLTIHYIDLYPLKQGDSMILEADQSTNTWLDGIELIWVMRSADTMIEALDFSSGNLTYTAKENCFLRLYTYYHGGTMQPQNRYDIRNSFKVYAGGGLLLHLGATTIDLSDIGGGSNISSIQTWGDSLFAAGKIQAAINTILPNATIKNCGHGSDYVHNVAARFVSYFTDDVPIGANIYPFAIPPLSERQKELKESFFVFLMGTNDLYDYYSSDDKYQTMLRGSYEDSFFRSLKMMIDLIPHDNWIVINGHTKIDAPQDDKYLKAMRFVDEKLQMLYPLNSLAVRELFLHKYDYLGVYLSAGFVIPNVSGSVTISLNSTTNLSNGMQIGIGTKDKFDLYTITAKTATNITASLVSLGTGFSNGETMPATYSLPSVADNIPCTLKTQVFRYDDITNGWQNKLFPKSAMADIVHPTDSGYKLIGQIIGKRLLNI